tara:strand:- start:5501 stop:6472 length:972 start_codon:yes stop_codon:yes gene_type:complete
MQNTKTIINNAINVIKTEINGIKQLNKTINNNFAKAVLKLSKIKGRVIITGIGKSGHIASKIASTMSSTGTPAQFCLSSEMSHGDLGIISKKDMLIIISNSGSSAELLDVISYAKKNLIPTIGISSNMKSELMKSSTFALLIPKAKEACAVGMAPTTSTSMALVLGDALCVSLMKVKKFDINRYRDIHPGGALGASLIKVDKIMHTGKKIPLVNEKAKMKEVIIEMTKKSFGHVGIINSKKNIVGIITDGDLRRNLTGKFLEEKVKNLMTKRPKIISHNQLMISALKTMNDNKITCLFISNKKSPKKPIGIIHIHDCLRFAQS